MNSINILKIFFDQYEHSKDKDEVDRLILESDLSTIFHTPIWLKEISEISNNKGFYLLLKNKNDEKVGVIPFFEVIKKNGTEFWSGEAYLETIYGGLVTYNNTHPIDSYYNLILKYLLKFNKCLRVNISFPPYFSSVGFDSNKSKRVYNTGILDISSDIDQIWSTLSKKGVQYMVNKCSKKNFTLRVNYESDLALFYEVMTSIFRKKGREPLDFNLYKRITDIFNCYNNQYKTNGVFISVLDGKEFIGGIIGVSFMDKMYYLASAVSEKGKDNGVNDFLIWELIKWGKSIGCKTFDTLRFGINNDRVGRFKMKYSREVIPLYNFNIISKYGYFIKVLNKFARK